MLYIYMLATMRTVTEKNSSQAGQELSEAAQIKSYLNSLELIPACVCVTPYS